MDFIQVPVKVKPPKSKYAPCSGVIVFNDDNTILVRTDLGHYSFPKGKRDSGETDIQAALRELYEETGLTSDHIEILQKSDESKTEESLYFSLDEINEKNNITIRYFIAKLIKPINVFTFDQYELASVEWINISDAYKLHKFLPRRKDILKQSYDYYKQLN
jgi:bis(5'-nucleosidyl)-tetraphosphatase